jgi:hypothetical protein
MRLKINCNNDYRMNKISLCGLIPFIVLSFHYNSHGMLIIAINGLLFHNFPNNKTLYFIDFTTNAFLYVKACLNFFFVVKYALFVLFVFLLNNRFFKNYKTLCEITHVIFVQWVGLYAIIDVYRHDKCFPLLFLC